MAETGRSERTIQRARAALVAAGAIRVEVSRGRHANRYYFPFAPYVLAAERDIPNPVTSDTVGTAPTPSPVTPNPVMSDAQPRHGWHPKEDKEGDIEGTRVTAAAGSSCSRCGAGFDLHHDTGELCGRCWFLETRANRRQVTG